MSTINKVPASAGAEWLLRGFALLRKAPLALGVLGLIWGLVSLLVVMVATAIPSLFYGLQLVLVLAGPLFFAGMIWAIREVDQGRPTLPAHLLHPIRDGHARSLLATLLPQMLAGLVLVALLFALIGPDQLNHLLEVWAKLQAAAEEGGQPDPAIMDGLPAGRLLLWLLIVFVVFVAVKWMTFVAAPQVIFCGVDPISAMRNSLRACLRNWAAMLVFYLLAGITIFAVAIGLLFFVSVLQLIIGAALALMLWQFVLMAVLMPLLAGAVYHAWQQMLGAPEAETTAEVALPTTHFEA